MHNHLIEALAIIIITLLAICFNLKIKKKLKFKI